MRIIFGLFFAYQATQASVDDIVGEQNYTSTAGSSDSILVFYKDQGAKLPSYILNTQGQSQTLFWPIRIEHSGDNTKVNIKYGSDTDTYGSCSLEYQNIFYVFGGYWQMRQVDSDFEGFWLVKFYLKVSIVKQCQLERIDDLDYDVFGAACGVFSQNFEKEIALLCFSAFDSTGCHRWVNDDVKVMNHTD